MLRKFIKLYIFPVVLVSLAALFTYLFFPTVFPLVVLCIVSVAYIYGFRPALISLVFGIAYFHIIYNRSGENLGLEPIKLISFVTVTSVLSFFVSKFHNLRKKLAVEKQRYEMVITAAPDVIISTDSKGRVVFSSHRIFDILGYKPDELQGESIELIMPKGMDSLHSQKFKEYVKTGEKTFNWVNHQIPVLKKNGEIILMEISLGEYTIQGKQFFTGILRDVSEREKLQSALKVSDERFALAQEAADIASFEWYPKTREISWSRNIEKIYGVKDSEFTSDKFNQLLHPDDRDRVKGILQKLTNGELFDYNTEFKIIRPDGETRWLSARGKLFPNGKGMRLIGSNVDITSQKQYEVALKASEERFKVQFKNAPVPIFTWQKHGNDFILIDFNDATLELTHGKPSVLLGKSALETYSKENPEIIEYMNYAFDNKTVLKKSGVYRLRTTGEEKYLNATLSYVPDDILLIHMEDVTAQHDAHLQLVDSIRVAAEASAAKDQFLAILSHELRTPMASILGYSNLLNSKKLSPPEERDALKAIEHSAKLQVSLINDLLDVSRIVSGKIVIKDLIVGVPGVVKQLMASVRPTAVNKHLVLKEEIPNEVLFVKGDPERLQQAIVNIVDNAIKFTESGEISISIVRRGLSVDIIVKDTGIGISDEMKTKLFQKFVQGENALQRKYKGLGLGLYITKSIIDLHHGTIHVESEVGKGTTMTISLPLISPPLAEPVTAPATSPKNDLTSITILVVDDDPDTLAMLKLSLEGYGATVFPSDSAEKGLMVLSENKIDVIVSDVGMAIMDGLMFMERLRKSGNNTPSIALTAFDGPQYELEARAKGFNGFLSKPIGIQSLVTEILDLHHTK